MQINFSGEFHLLIIKGNATEDECRLRWEDIIKANGKQIGNLQFIQVFTDAQTYALLYQEYLFLKACLTYLAYNVDIETVNMLKEEGYVIDTENGADKYDSSLELCHQQANNLTNQINIKQSEIERQQKEDKKVQPSSGSGFEEAIANISHLIGFQVGDDITLARYNEYCKIVKKKYERKNREETYN